MDIHVGDRKINIQSGRKVTVNTTGGKTRIIVDGKEVHSTGDSKVVVKVLGDVQHLDCINAEIHGDAGNVDATHMHCKNVHGNVNATQVHCGDIAGSVNATQVNRR